MNDQRLDKLIQGDSGAWQDLYMEISPGLFRFVLSRVGDRHAAQDIMQEGFYRLAKNLRQIRDSISIKSWLYSTCYRLTVDWHRQRDASSTDLTLEDRSAFDPEEAAVRHEQDQAVLDAVLSLSEPHRTVVLLRIWGGLSYSEIAEITGLSEGTLRSQFYWAVRKLRQMLRSHCSGLWKDVSSSE